MNIFLKNLRRALTGIPALVLLWLLHGCANIVPPSGGEKDLSAPVLLSINPEDSALNVRVSKIELRFNKFMEIHDLDKNLQISPLLPVNPTVISYGKRIEIKITDSLLQPNTTYRMDFGNALVDNREATPYKNAVYLFSTGSYFDSLKLEGRVFRAETGLPDTAATVLLYPESENDSSILLRKPAYAQKVDVSGHFTFSFLPAKIFRVYALSDLDHNYNYDPATEEIDFLDQTVLPSSVSDSALIFHIFRAKTDSAGIVQPENTIEKKTLHERSRERSLSRNDPGYNVGVDTSNRNRGSMELTQPLPVEFHKPLSLLDTTRVYLSYDDNGIEVEAVRTLKVDSNRMQIFTAWQPDKVYTLRLVKGWAKDTSGTELLPGKYFFRTKRMEDYGTLKVHVDGTFTGTGYLLYLFKGTDSVYQKNIQHPDITIPLLQPGDYNLRIIMDENKNGKWDTGDFFKKKHAEKVIPYSGGNIIIKGGWENEVDFKKPDETENKNKTKNPGNPGVQKTPGEKQDSLK